MTTIRGPRWKVSDFNLPGQLMEVASALRARVRIGFPYWLRLFAGRDVVAITLGRSIYLRQSMQDRAESELVRILLHELTHVRQVARHGLVGFLIIYVRDYVRLRRSGLPAFHAYSAIPFEQEARAAERNGDGLGTNGRTL